MAHHIMMWALQGTRWWLVCGQGAGSEGRGGSRRKSSEATWVRRLQRGSSLITEVLAEQQGQPPGVADPEWSMSAQTGTPATDSSVLRVSGTRRSCCQGGEILLWKWRRIDWNGGISVNF